MKTYTAVHTNTYELVCIEAESSEKRTRTHGKGAGVRQVFEAVQPGHTYDYRFSGYYLPRLYYTHAFVTGPFCEDSQHPQVGVISCNEKGELIFKKGKPCREPVDEGVQIVKNIINASLVRRLPPEKRYKLLGLKVGKFGFDEYYESILELGIDTILEFL